MHLLPMAWPCSAPCACAVRAVELKYGAATHLRSLTPVSAQRWCAGRAAGRDRRAMAAEEEKRAPCAEVDDA